jgi:predicted nucleic acid-binding protein
VSEATQSVLADTGPLYAAVDTDDGQHTRAHHDLVRLVDENIDVVVAGSTLLECYTLVVQRLGPAVARRWLNEIESGAQIIQPSLDDLTAAADLVRNHSQGDNSLTMFDAVFVVLSNRLSIPLWTYDDRFVGMQVGVWGSQT